MGKITLVARDMAMNQSCYAIMARNKGQEHYIHQLSLYAADSIKQKSNGAVFDAINAKDITEESVPDITTYDIISFEREVTPLYDMIWENGKEIRSLSAIRDYLLPKLMSGEIDVSTLKIPTKYSFGRLLGYVLLVCILHIFLIDHGIMKRRIDPYMA